MNAKKSMHHRDTEMISIVYKSFGEFRIHCEMVLMGSWHVGIISASLW